MKTENYFKITEDGSVQKVQVNTEEVSVTEKFKEQLSSGVLRKLHGAFRNFSIHESLGNNVAHCAIVNGTGHCTWTVELPYLPMTTHFKVSEDSVMTPSFSRAENPLASLQWRPLPGMRLLWLIQCFKSGTQYGSDKQFLLARGDNGVLFRLPISNLYDDCRICTGDYNGMGASHLDVLQKAFTQLLKSQWQGDLYDHQPDSYKERTDRLFRFKPDKKEGFEQMPPVLASGKTWQNYCETVSTEWLTQNLTIA